MEEAALCIFEGTGEGATDFHQVGVNLNVLERRQPVPYRDGWL